MVSFHQSTVHVACALVFFSVAEVHIFGRCRHAIQSFLCLVNTNGSLLKRFCQKLSTNTLFYLCLCLLQYSYHNSNWINHSTFYCDMVHTYLGVDSSLLKLWGQRSLFQLTIDTNTAFTLTTIIQFSEAIIIRVETSAFWIHKMYRLKIDLFTVKN